METDRSPYLCIYSITYNTPQFSHNRDMPLAEQSNAEERASNAPAIEIEGVTHRYDKSTAVLNDVNLSLGTGFFGLLGANGAGKSTLMRIICTLLRPSEGNARVCGYDVVRECHRVREKIGYLPQSFSAWRLHRTEEVVDTLAALSGMTKKKERRQRVAEVLEEVGLTDVADRKVKKLSGGMVRRLGVAQAMVHNPEVLVVDEPTVGLDPEERMRFRQVMTNMGQDRTILLSTHIVADLGSGCSQIALIDDGTVAFQGTPSTLLDQARGQVFEITVPLESSNLVEEKHEIVSRTVQGADVSFRVVVDDRKDLTFEATEVGQPSLEEAYLAFMAMRGKLERARQDEEHNAAEAPATKKSRWGRRKKNKND